MDQLTIVGYYAQLDEGTLEQLNLLNDIGRDLINDSIDSSIGLLLLMAVPEVEEPNLLAKIGEIKATANRPTLAWLEKNESLFMYLDELPATWAVNRKNFAA